MTKEELEALQKEWIKQVEMEDASIKETHSKKELTFTQVEARQLLKVAAMQAMSKRMADTCQSLIDDLLNNTVLPRVGVTPTPDKKILFEPTLGRFILWTPRTLSKPIKNSTK